MEILIYVQIGKYGNVKHVFLFYFWGIFIYVNIYVVVVYFHTHHGFQPYIDKCISCNITIDYQFLITTITTGTTDLSITVSP
jgi:hypothetical protein